MKNTRKLTCCAVLSALAVVVLMMTAFPYATYALAAFAGMVFIPAALEMGTRYGVCCYAVTAVLALLLTPDPEAKWLFIFFFGYYPIVALRIHLWQRCIFRWVTKLAVFNAAVLASYAVLKAMSQIDVDAFLIGGVSLPGVLWAMGNVLFVVYDVCLVRITAMYRVRLHPIVKRFFQ